MKKLAILFMLASIILFSCSKKPKPEVKEDNFLKISEYTTEEYKPASTPMVTPTYSGSETYWYVTFEEQQKDYGTDWHRAIVLKTPYFDFMEARKQLPVEVTGRVYFDFMLQINKESYESFFKFREENQKIVIE